MDYPIQSPGQLSSQLRALRKTRRLSQAQLGAMLGVGQSRITRIERDPTAISVEQFLEVLSALGVTMVLRPAVDRAVRNSLDEAAEHPSPAKEAANHRRPPASNPADEPW